MGYTFKAYTAKVMQSGTVSITMYYDSSITITHPDTIEIVNLGEFVERVEISTGITEMPEVSLTVAENYTTHTEGYWYKLFAASVDKDPVRFLFEINEGSGNVWLFDGYVDLISVQINEDYISGSTHLRSLVNFTVFSRLKALEDATIASWVTDLLTHWVVEDAPLATVTNLALTPTDNEATEYGYRVAVRDATYEYVWCAEVTEEDGPATLGGAKSVALAWDAVAGASNYAVYRTINGSVPASVGLISITAANSLTDDGLALIATGSTQLRRSSRQFVRVTDLFRSALSAGLGLTSGETNVTIDTHDIIFLNAADEYTPDTTYVLFSKNYGDLASPNWGRADYFLSTSANYFGVRHQNLLALIGSLATQFGYYLRYNSTPTIELLTRGRVGSTITLDGSLISSQTTITTPVVAKTVRIFRIQDDTEVWLSSANMNEYDLDIGIYFGVYDVDQTLNDYEYLYEKTTAGAIVTFDEMDGAAHYDYDTGDHVNSSTDYKMQEALGNYYYKLSYRKRRDYFRKYTSIQSSGSHVGVKALCRTEISDGVATRTFYANEVRKDIWNNILSVQWIQQ